MPTPIHSPTQSIKQARQPFLAASLHIAVPVCRARCTTTTCWSSGCATCWGTSLSWRHSSTQVGGWVGAVVGCLACGVWYVLFARHVNPCLAAHLRGDSAAASPPPLALLYPSLPRPDHPDAPPPLLLLRCCCRACAQRVCHGGRHKRAPPLAQLPHRAPRRHLERSGLQQRLPGPVPAAGAAGAQRRGAPRQVSCTAALNCCFVLLGCCCCCWGTSSSERLLPLCTVLYCWGMRVQHRFGLLLISLCSAHSLTACRTPLRCPACPPALAAGAAGVHAGTQPLLD